MDMRDKAVHYLVAIKMREVGIYRLADHGHHYNKDWFIPFDYCYDPEDPSEHMYWETELNNSNEDRISRLVKAPHQASLRNWLREYQEIDIEIIRHNDRKYRAKVGKDKMRSVTEDRKVKVFEEYYDAMDSALLQALSLLPEF